MLLMCFIFTKSAPTTSFQWPRETLAQAKAKLRRFWPQVKTQISSQNDTVSGQTLKLILNKEKE